MTVFVDANADKPLTPAEIKEIVDALKEIHGIDGAEVVVNIITTNFEPEEDVADKIKELTTPVTVPGIKSVDDTTGDFDETIEELKK